MCVHSHEEVYLYLYLPIYTHTHTQAMINYCSSQHTLLKIMVRQWSLAQTLPMRLESTATYLNKSWLSLRKQEALTKIGYSVLEILHTLSKLLIFLKDRITCAHVCTHTQTHRVIFHLLVHIPDDWNRQS